MASVAHDGSMEGSRTWSACASLCSQFPWLSQPLSCVVEAADTHVEVKLQEIRSCLDGDDEVDLWHLRELALTRGGLLSAQVRKRAWPKLMGAHHQVLLHASANADASSYQQCQVEITERDMQLVQQDIARSVWNIEDSIHNNREEERSKKVTFLPGLLVASPTPSLVTLNDKNKDGIISPLVASPMSTPQSQLYISPRNRVASSQEQRALQNTIVSLLRTPPENGGRYRYYHGLHDLTAVLLINLESPSLTCLILRKLASHPLRDALRGENDDSLKRAVELVFGGLLEQVDVTLFHHFQKQYPIAWIAPWFTSHMTNLQAASRLMDVFLVSHATMPIYMAVALVVCQYREKLLAATSSDFHEVMRNLPRDLLLVEEESLEDVIALALQYMRLYPPSTLLLREMDSSITMLQDPPAWSMSATAPTDWTLLQQAKALRLGESPPPMHFLPDSHRNYHLAMTALGMQPPKRRRGWRLLLLVVLLGAVAAACYGMRVQPNTVVSSPTSIVTTKLVPTTKRKKKHCSTVNKAVKCVDTGCEVNKKHHRRRVEVQIHNTSRVNHAIDTNKSTNKVMTRKPWMELFTGATPPEVKTKRKQVPKWLERFIVECDKIKWKGHRFLI